MKQKKEVSTEGRSSGIESGSSQEITVYTAKWCGACKKRVPVIMKKAQAAGLRVKLVDWDDDLSTEDRERLIEEVEFVPFIDYMGREIDEGELDRIRRVRRGCVA